VGDRGLVARPISASPLRANTGVLRVAQNDTLCGLGHEQQSEHDAFADEHAEGGVLAVPEFGLPHEEPLATDGDEGYEPEQHAGGEGGDGFGFGVGEGGVVGAEGLQKSGDSEPCERGVEGFPGDDADVEGEVHPCGMDGAPEAFVVGEGGVHHEDVADELVVGVEVGDVVEDDEGEEECDSGDEGDLGETGCAGHGSY